MSNLNVSTTRKGDSKILKIKLNRNLLNEEANSIRRLINLSIKYDIDQVFIDSKNVENINLSGINEVIHSHYLLQKTHQKLILVYKDNTEMKKWVSNTGLENFIETAIIPS